MFGKDLLEDKNLWRHIPKLIGGEKEKPFECVGTTRENAAALAMGYKNAAKKPYILERFYEENKLPGDNKIKQIMKSWDNKNFIPEDIRVVLKLAVKNSI